MFQILKFLKFSLRCIQKNYQNSGLKQNDELDSIMFELRKKLKGNLITVLREGKCCLTLKNLN